MQSWYHFVVPVAAEMGLLLRSWACSLHLYTIQATQTASLTADASSRPHFPFLHATLSSQVPRRQPRIRNGRRRTVLLGKHAHPRDSLGHARPRAAAVPQHRVAGVQQQGRGRIQQGRHGRRLEGHGPRGWACSTDQLRGCHLPPRDTIVAARTSPRCRIGPAARSESFAGAPRSHTRTRAGKAAAQAAAVAGAGSLRLGGRAAHGGVREQREAVKGLGQQHIRGGGGGQRQREPPRQDLAQAACQLDPAPQHAPSQPRREGRRRREGRWRWRRRPACPSPARVGRRRCVR